MTLDLFSSSTLHFLQAFWLLHPLLEQHFYSSISSHQLLEVHQGPVFLAGVAPKLSFPDQQSRVDTGRQLHARGHWSLWSRTPESNRKIWSHVHVGHSCFGAHRSLVSMHVLYLVSKLQPMRKGEESDSRCDKTRVTAELRCSLLAAGVSNKLEQSGVREEWLDPNENHFGKNVLGLQICLRR